MKRENSSSSKSDRPRSEVPLKDRKGVALVTVLTIMALCTIMILAFFTLATSENQASSTYSRGLHAQQIAEQSVNLIIAQVRKATTDTNRLWASQPGMIRTWTGGGQFVAYKLYSDDKMEETNEAEFKLSADQDFSDIKNWSQSPARFVDLNEPVIRGDKVYYPIVDPYSRDYPEWPKPQGNDSGGVEGFDFNWDGAHSIGKSPLDDLVSSKNGGIGHLPMPVMWIYQLEDGTLGTLDGSNNFQPFFASGTSGTATEHNRIVARFAFWADDESTKLNINTSAGGLAWDIPKAGGGMDRRMGEFQPARHEWQRYPGHPASTHLKKRHKGEGRNK